MTDRDDEKFLSRWSRRKRSGGAAPVVALPVTETAAEAPAATEPRRGPPLPHAARLPQDAPADAAAPAPDDAVAELPDIDSLDEESDYSVFMRDGVPEHLRRLALRKLWLSSPVHSIIDGLDDYDDDFTKLFTDAATKAAKTVYEAGKRAVTPEEGAGPETAGAGDTAARDDRAVEGAVDDEEPPTDDRPRTQESLTEAGDAAGDDGDPDAKG